ncbi:N-6 DNA methylase [Nocardia sp. CNY236]|uniref:Eco57I restriction-modification methylase domain-containing protein n=1 Tax=Nocardia sp. CNY236 TaxID=1169152 RepID=UPI0003F8169A|nr:N-6 DNA methylase [Nocardia sp. CNY236]
MPAERRYRSAKQRRDPAPAVADPAAGECKRFGRHYTPPALARFLAHRVVSQAAPSQAGVLRVLDPACGNGELLLAAHTEATARFPGMRLVLTGYDLDAQAIVAARERAEAAGVAARWYAADFLAAGTRLTQGSFDAVITNPPYVRTQQLGGSTAHLLRRRFGLHGRIDLTHPFVATLPRLLAGGGVLGLLCANRFLTTKAGANIRDLLLSDLSPIELYDLGDTKLFAAAVLPAIIIARRADYRGGCRYISIYETAGRPTCALSLFDALVTQHPATVGHKGRVFAIEAGTLLTGAESRARGSAPPTARGRRSTRDRGTARSGGGASLPQWGWRMSHAAVDSWLARVEARTWRTFGEVARVRVGIKTTADRIFISDRWADADPCPEPELLRALLTHRELAPWRATCRPDLRVLYPYDPAHARPTPIDFADFPAAAAYLSANKEALAGRRYLIDSGRAWFEIWVPQRPRLWREPKVVFPDISDRPRFALDRSGAVVNGDCYWISLPELSRVPVDALRLAYLLMGVANSSFGVRFYDVSCGNRLYSHRRRWTTEYVSRMPLPDPTLPRSAAVIDLVRELIEHHPPDRAALGELDRLVESAFGVP